jgi:lipid-A-disaccharide synthase
MKYYLIAGEASGDLHGSNLISELKKLDASARFRCWGGDNMKAAGADVVRHIRHLAFMGFTEVLLNLHTIVSNFRFCKKDILQFRPDVLILIDYPGFNLRIARWAKQQGLKVIYYISPQVWAWKENRVKMMKQCIDKMLVIFPFEKEYYKNKWHWHVEYVGHPLVEVIDRYKLKAEGIEQSEKPVVALLPGSRKQEIRKKLPLMLAVSKFFPDYQFVVAKAPGVDDAFYTALLQPFRDVKTVSGQTYGLLIQARAALVTSGTATLETALFEVPQVVCYKTSALSYQLGKRLVKVKYIAMVNLILDKPAVKELIQYDLTVENLKTALQELLTNASKINTIRNDYAALKKLLGEKGNASANAARVIYQFLNAAATSLPG